MRIALGAGITLSTEPEDAEAVRIAWQREWLQEPPGGPWVAVFTVQGRSLPFTRDEWDRFAAAVIQVDGALAEG